ncbi:hypothetical protein DPMN_017198 [Dreissena polymorpha]|uniref:Uncharacterized protein n=1 Tax=Dreissena polymorpha TaxID=45954 RepID=A0A9D4NAY9_DREPO|nr:hypothetical protein DPMN_017198 [Dreissena polymorpha]
MVRQRDIMREMGSSFISGRQRDLMRDQARNPVRVFQEGNQHQHARPGAMALSPEPEYSHFGVHLNV